MLDSERRLLEILVGKSFKQNNEKVYPLASGAKSRYYVDCKLALSHPEVRDCVGQLAVERLKSMSFDAIGGLELGAYPIAIAISDGFYKLIGERLRVFVIRKRRKEHGLQKWIEGDVREGDRVLIVDDVMTSGHSTIKAVKRSREAGLTVVQSLALLDREEGARQTLENAGIAMESLFTLSDLRDFHMVLER